MLKSQLRQSIVAVAIAAKDGIDKTFIASQLRQSIVAIATSPVCGE